LLKLGVTKSDIILLNSQNNIPYAVTSLAAYFLGIAISPSKPSHNTFEVSNQIADSGASIVFTDKGSANITKHAIDSLKNTNSHQIKLAFIFDGEYNTPNVFKQYQTLLEEGQGKKLSKIPYFEVDPKNDVATIVYTSGSTGLPKGALMTHYPYISAFCVAKELNIFQDDSIFSGHYPFGHVSGTFLLTAALTTNSRMILLDNTEIENIVKAVEKYKVK
jgi:fatty-acyl-CoA synthase